VRGKVHGVLHVDTGLRERRAECAPERVEVHRKRRRRFVVERIARVRRELRPLGGFAEVRALARLRRRHLDGRHAVHASATGGVPSESSFLGVMKMAMASVPAEKRRAAPAYAQSPRVLHVQYPTEVE
jgi:hypothetical protein